MKESELDKDEQELLDQFEAGEFKSVMTPTRKRKVRAAAEETLKKGKRKNS